MKQRSLWLALAAFVVGTPPPDAASAASTQGTAATTRPARAHAAQAVRPLFRDAKARAAFCDTLEAVTAALETPGAPRVCAKDRRRLQRVVDTVRHDRFFDRRAA